MQTKSKKRLSVLTECSIMIALATVLSIIKLFELPYGGSITVASMLPLVIITHRHGTAVGLTAAFAASVIQLLLGLNNLSYFTTWYSIIAIILLDYIFAFLVFGLSGIFRKIVKNQASSMVLGVFLASVLRYVCHVISGATVWAGLSIPSAAALIYSIGYNATYMIPETVVLMLAAAYIGSALDFSKAIPMPKAKEKLNTGATVFKVLSGLSILCALITDAVLVFSKLQNPETGDFMITGITSVNWALVAIVTAACALCSAILFLISKKLKK